jgi:FkbM family methyltransferase
MKIKTIRAFFFSDAVSNVIKGLIVDPKLLATLILTIVYAIIKPKKRVWARELFERIFYTNYKHYFSLFFYCIRRLDKSNSWDFQDLIVLYLQKKYIDSDYKTYLEIGAHDGFYKSNCYLLMNSNWSGVCVEPNPITYLQCKTTRLSAHVVNAAFGNKDKTQKLRYFWPENRESNGTVLASHEIAQNPTSNYIDVDVIGVKDVIKFYTDKKIGYVSIDTEGGEVEIAKSLLNEESLSIAMFSIEHNFDQKKIGLIAKTFAEKGYVEILHGLCRNDSFFIKENLFPKNVFNKRIVQ